VGQREYGDIERELLAVFSTNALAFIAGVVGAEGAAKAIFAHHGNQVALVKKAIQLNIPGFVKAAYAVNFMKRAVDDVVVRDGFDLFIGKDLAELASPCARKTRPVATTGSEKESAMTQIFA
jgi:hypothetical protein